MKSEHWDLVIRPRRSIFDIDLKAIWEYRDLLAMFVRRDIVVVYKQTILGPLWFFVQPILTTLIYILVFGRIAKISTDGVPMILFYLSGVIMWNYFSECFNITAKTFTENANIFGKVYFPRLIMPLSKVISGLIKFGIQFALFLLVYFYFLFNTNSIHPNFNLLLVPYLVALMAILGLGFGIIFTSLTTKYRDLNFLIAFGVQLLMYATPVIYPVSAIPEKYKLYIMANPMTPIIEAFKNAFLGAGHISLWGLVYATLFTLVVFLLGILIFNKTEQNFIDTV
ncbi:MAG TPA: ABC transporter permease [Bacteroidales bacterium]|nr:ABC transporter permease [Bacteroidales bacterium]HPO65376.1 ABC transporter permease [Bacteroidales bacterium]